MIDGSSLPLEQNIELTREVVKYAHARGVSVEGELGVLGGQEDHVFAATSTYTNPLDAVKFIQETEVDGRKRTYRITPKGRAVYQEEVDRLRSCLMDAEEEGIL